MNDFVANNAVNDDIVSWIEENMYDWSKVTVYGGEYDYSKAPKLILLPYQKDILSHLFKKDSEGLFPYSTIIWSQPKKHGKTQIAACVSAWFGCNVEPPNILLTMASNQEQSAGLIFNSMVPSLYALGGKVPPSAHAVPEVRLPNGTVIKAIPNNYAGQAGGNYGFTAWSELWTGNSERYRKLWDETPPVPTRKNSIRWVETYAGFEDESAILQDQYKRIWPHFNSNETTPNARPVPGLEHIVTRRNGETIPSCWHIPEEDFFVFWDNEIRAPWITERYLRAQKAENRHATFTRLWKNLWQSSIGGFIEPEQWEACLTEEAEEWGPMILAGDASQRNDTTALVGVQKRKVVIFGKEQERYRVMRVRIWDPKKMPTSFEMRQLGAKKFDIDLEETIAREVKRLYEMGIMDGPFYYDPFQMHQIAVNLRKMKVPCQEFPQGQERLKADSYLWKMIKGQQLDAFPSQLSDHIKSAAAKEYENQQVRIIKGTATEMKKVDAAVALSMAVWKASKRIPMPIKKKPKTSTSTMF